MSQAKQYRVTVQFPDGVAAQARRRGGVDIHRDYGYVGPLDKEQLEAIEADPYLTVTDANEVDTTEGEVQALEVIRNAENQAGTIVAEAEAEAARIKADAEAEAEATRRVAEKDANAVATLASDEATKLESEAEAKADETLKAAKDAGDKIIADAKAKSQPAK